MRVRTHHSLSLSLSLLSLMAIFSQSLFSLYFSPKPTTKPTFHLSSNRKSISLHSTKSELNPSSSLTPPPLEKKETISEQNPPSNLASNGVVVNNAIGKFKDERWVKGTWDLAQFMKNGRTDWDSVIDAEARRRKWLEEFPEATNNEDAVYFDTSVIPWFAWIKWYHLPEAEKLNGRAAMIGFFMAYFVDSLTGVGLVDQTSNFFCKTLLFISVVGVLFVRNNEDIETLKKVLEETTFYDKQWQSTWQDDSSDGSKK